MQRVFCLALLASAFGMTGAFAQPMQIAPGYYATRGNVQVDGQEIEVQYAYPADQQAPMGAQASARPAYAQPAVQPVPLQPPYPQALAQPAPPEPAYPRPVVQPVPVQQPYRQPDLGGGFIEFLFGGGAMRPQYQTAPVIQGPVMQQPVMQQPVMAPPAPPPVYANANPAMPARPAMDPRYLKQVVDYSGPEKSGTIIIDTPKRHLFLVQENGKAIRYGIGVGRPGFTWAGAHAVSSKKEWPDWRPPDEMLERRPDLPHFMAGGPDNPLGARAMYLGSTLYRIHGSNEPWTIGHAVSSGCIRMRNEDVIDLYDRVKVGTRVVVI